MEIDFKLTNNSCTDFSITEKILEIISWKAIPTFYSKGRTAHLILKESGEARIFKIKGVGCRINKVLDYSTLEKIKLSQKIITPTTKEYLKTSYLKHFGISNLENKFIVERSEKTPYGGILHRRAVAEYNNLDTLFGNDIPCNIPVLTCKYPSLVFNNESLGIVCSELLDSNPFSILQIINLKNSNTLADSDTYLRDLCTSLNIENVNGELLYPLLLKYGNSLFKFSSCGLYRHSGGLDNMFFSSRSKEIYFSDVDSSLQLKKIDFDKQILQIIRDLASVVYKLYKRIFNKELVIYNGNYFQGIQLTILSFLKGYFVHTDERLLTDISIQINDYVRFVTMDVQNVEILEQNKNEIYCSIFYYVFKVLDLRSYFPHINYSVDFKEVVNMTKDFIGHKAYLEIESRKSR